MSPTILPHVDRELVERKGLSEFIRQAWHVVEPACRYIHGKHIDVISKALERTRTGECRRLVINVPPGFTKSLITSVLYPAWVWTEDPSHRFIAASHDSALAYRDADRLRDLVRSEWYQDRWGDVCQIDSTRTKADTKGVYYTTATGMRMSTTVGSRGVGWHAHTQLVDDPIKPADAAAATSARLENANAWWRNTMSSRLVDHATAVRLVTMQRVHIHDLSEQCLEAGYEHVCLPMVASPSHPYRHPDDWREDGELLWPERFPAHVVETLREAMGPQVAAAQLDQLPAPPGGNVFKDEWMVHRWDELPPRGVWCTSWDHTFGSLKKTGSYVTGQVWYFSGPYSFMVDQVRGRMEFPRMLAEMKALKARHPQCLHHLVEAKASGPSIEQTLRMEMPGIIMISADSSTGGKLARAHSVTGMFASGHVAFPKAPWVGDLLVRFQRFSGADADVADEIDACTQALSWHHGSGVARFIAAMNRVRSERNT